MFIFIQFNVIKFIVATWQDLCLSLFYNKDTYKFGKDVSNLV